MDGKQYELRTYQHVHSMDVRCVASLPLGNGFVTGSRDRLAKLFVENEMNMKFDLEQVYKDAKHFIASLYVQVDDQNESTIFAGSNDGIIYVYGTNSPHLKRKITGHESTVCGLDGDQSGRQIISSSWDKTARVWVGDFESCRLIGHEAAVWSACFLSDIMVVTGSADKTIKLWNLATHECKRTIDAHTDCVRDVKAISKNQFLSCSNDAKIKRWTTEGVCLEEYDGHENYIYSISLIINDEQNLKFASCSEDKTMRIWKNGQSQQSIRIPAQTLWSVCTTINNELVVGCSNGHVYVYTQDERLFAPEAIQNEIKKQVAETNIPLTELGDIKIDQLPDKNGLGLPGKREGETKIIREGKSLTVYQWNATKYEWTKVGDVVGAANKNKESNKKQEYEGKFYDYVFSVDIKEGAPPLKLPYNVHQNPWMVAQQFIEKNELSQSYLDEIADFIIKNSQQTPADLQSRAQPPADPFTGASSYRPTSSKIDTSKSLNQLVNDYYPLKDYFLFENINLDGVQKKLLEFNKNFTEETQISTDGLMSLLDLNSLHNTITDDQLEMMKRILKWPQINLFPVLDFMRMAVLIARVCDELCSTHFVDTFLSVLLESVTNENSTPNQYLSLRCLCNMFKNASSAQFIKTFDQTILAKVNTCLLSENKNVQVALSTFYMNFALYICKHSANDFPLKTDLALNSIQLLQDRFDPEAQFRSLVTLGTIVEHDKHLMDMIRSEELVNFLFKISNNAKIDKLSKCARILHAKIKG